MYSDHYTPDRAEQVDNLENDLDALKELVAFLTEERNDAQSAAAFLQRHNNQLMAQIQLMRWSVEAMMGQLKGTEIQ